MLADGIIEESDSSWSSPPIPVRKKNGTIRIAVDYRKMNIVTIYNPFYMPSTEEVISSLGQANLLSKMDLAKGFHQVPMATDSKDKTTFSCKFGKFRYLRMPFGLRNAPSTFQIMMQRCLKDLELFSSPCIDDVVMFSNSWPDHLHHLFQVMSRLKEYGLTVKISKCLWDCKPLEFLGYVVGEGQLSIPKARIHSFQLYVRPRIKKQLLSFI